MTPTEKDRSSKEMIALFNNPANHREAWRSVGRAILQSPCIRPVQTFGKDGMPTYDSMVEQYTYDKLKRDIDSLVLAKQGEPREPTELEMILHCQMVKARTDTAAATFIRDTLGAKPIDESKIEAQVNNPYEQLTDEEIDMLMRHREEAARQTLQQPEDTPLPDTDQVDMTDYGGETMTLL